jgi:hypothetical protein
MTATVNDTARSLVAFFGTLPEWGRSASAVIDDPAPELVALVDTILGLVPAGWSPYSPELGRSDGYVVLPHPSSDPTGDGYWRRSMSVHSVARPPGWTEPDPATADLVTIRKAVAAALSGLAVMPERRQRIEAIYPDEDDAELTPAQVRWLAARGEEV